MTYRHEVLADLDLSPVRAEVRDFGRGMRQSREILGQARSMRSRWQQRRLFVDAVSAYCGAVISLATALPTLELRSRGMRALADYMAAYRSSRAFTALADEAGEIVTQLSTVGYTLNIKDTRVTVTSYRDEPDYAREMETFFAKFSDGPATEHAAAPSNRLNMNEVEAEESSSWSPASTPGLSGRWTNIFCVTKVSRTPRSPPSTVTHSFTLPISTTSVPCGTPASRFATRVFLSHPDSAQALDAFDLALAAKVASRPSQSAIVTNDFALGPDGRVLVITGPNNGGKTTFARAFGQLHYLASLGLLVPAREADLVLTDAVLTSFAQAERLRTGRSHLEEELVHLHRIVEHASARTSSS